MKTFFSTDSYFPFSKRIVKQFICILELFEDYGTMRKIMSARSPRKMKELGRKVKNFQGWIWRETCLFYVKEANMEKVSILLVW